MQPEEVGLIAIVIISVCSLFAIFTLIAYYFEKRGKKMDDARFGKPCVNPAKDESLLESNARIMSDPTKTKDFKVAGKAFKEALWETAYKLHDCPNCKTGINLHSGTIKGSGNMRYVVCLTCGLSTLKHRGGPSEDVATAVADWNATAEAARLEIENARQQVRSKQQSSIHSATLEHEEPEEEEEEEEEKDFVIPVEQHHLFLQMCEDVGLDPQVAVESVLEALKGQREFLKEQSLEIDAKLFNQV